MIVYLVSKFNKYAFYINVYVYITKWNDKGYEEIKNTGKKYKISVGKMINFDIWLL